LNERVTILNLTAEKKIAKAFRGADYQVVQFNPGSEFLVTQTTINNLKSLASVINTLKTYPHKTIIRGSLVEDQTNPVLRNKDTFIATPIATPRQWCMIDIDSLSVFHLLGEGEYRHYTTNKEQ
jgi:hypothetical protein